MFSGIMSRGKTRNIPYKLDGIILKVNVVNDAARYVHCLKMLENAGRASESQGGGGEETEEKGGGNLEACWVPHVSLLVATRK